MPFGETYEPAESGPKAIILAIEDEDGDPYDALAFFAKKPRRWWLRCGMAVALGYEAIEYAAETGEPLRVVETPLDWIEAHGNAVCVLDWRADIYGLLSSAQSIVCDTPSLAGKIRRAIARPRLEIGVRRAA